MMSEYEVIKTNAPISVVEEQLRMICNDEYVSSNPYKPIEDMGYIVEVIASSLDDNEYDTDCIEIDMSFF